jgi:hypothetical protein
VNATRTITALAICGGLLVAQAAPAAAATTTSVYCSAFYCYTQVPTPYTPSPIVTPVPIRLPSTYVAISFP